MQCLDVSDGTTRSCPVRRVSLAGDNRPYLIARILIFLDPSYGRPVAYEAPPPSPNIYDYDDSTSNGLNC